MTEQNQVKVYELAKELGIDSISLLDRLKGLNIKVKNHMSDLKEEEAQIVRSALKTQATPAASAKKTATRVRKKSAETAEPAILPAGASTKPVKTAAPATEVTAPAGKPPILRRRVKADGTSETTQSVPGGGMVALKSAAEVAAEAEAAAEEAVAATPVAESPVEVVVAAGTEVTGGEVAGATSSIADAPPAEEPAPVAKTPITFTRPVAPKKTFLKIVEAAAPPPRPMIKPAQAPSAKASAFKGQTTQDKDGFRIIKMTKENLDQMAEEEAARKRGGGGEKELRPEDVRFADYRKKEMVFLPKKKKIPVGKEIKRTQITTPDAKKRVVEIQDTVAVQELAAQMSVKATDVIRKLMTMGQMVSMNQAIDFDTATLVAQEFQYEVKNVAFKEENVIQATSDGADTLIGRPPIVTIMGHVDHGKTTLLDSIREANVAAGETGGITQHIGAYTVEKNGKQITFIDTPGHEAFTVMRARGANVTDIVILVVAADDGVMPQTREALSHAQAAKVPIIVAVNKIDKPGANPEKIKQGLAELNLLAEDWGGETQFVPVSALKKTGIDQLLEAILLQAEILDLKANPNADASGPVLEARVEKGRGPVVSLLVTRGTLKVGDAMVAGTHVGRVKALMDDKGRTVKTATPGVAVEVLGFEGVPNAGETFNALEDDTAARKIAESRIDKARVKAAASGAPGRGKLEELFAKIQAGEAKELGVILKADVFGSVEAIRDSLLKLSNDKVKVKIILAAPGGISESDVLLATASSALILGFNVRPETKARQLAEAEHIEIRSYGIIYELIDDVKNAMTGLLDKKKVERFLGRAEVRQTFTVPKIGTIAGSAVIDGKILRGANVRLLRDSRIIFDGKMSSLKRFKDDAKEVAQGYECGIGIENFNDIKTGDIIEAYQIDLVTPELNA